MVLWSRFLGILVFMGCKSYRQLPRLFCRKKGVCSMVEGEVPAYRDSVSAVFFRQMCAKDTSALRKPFGRRAVTTLHTGLFLRGGQSPADPCRQGPVENSCIICLWGEQAGWHDDAVPYS